MALWFPWLPGEVDSRTPGVATDQALGSRARCVSHILGLHFFMETAEPQERRENAGSRADKAQAHGWAEWLAGL